MKEIRLAGGQAIWGTAQKVILEMQTAGWIGK
jgi:hypothetical protein